MSITIGLSRGSGSPKYENYWSWIRASEPEAVIIDLYETPNLEKVLPDLDAVIMTGGGDIHPDVYGQPEAISLSDGIDQERDRREIQTLEYAFEAQLPVLGVCRGIQIINVHLGGPLVPHIPDEPNSGEYHGGLENGDNTHIIAVESGSLLHRAAGEIEGEVNSAHHQGVRELAPSLTSSATSPDGMIEAIEWQEPEQRSFLLAVQWHPERMDQENPFAGRLLEQFLIEAHSSKILKATSLPEPKREPEEIDIDSQHEKKDEGDSLLPIIQ